MGTPNYTYRCGGSIINAANANLDGTGTPAVNICALITGAGTLNCSMVNNVIIKGLMNTGEDIIRFFVDVPNNTQNIPGKLLVKEVHISSSDISGNLIPSVEINVPFDNLLLANNNTLWVTTEKGFDYAVTAYVYDLDSFS